MLKDKVCFITGASRGIGKCISETFAKEGAYVYAGHRGKEGDFDYLDAEYGHRIEQIFIDLTKTDSIVNAVFRIKEERGKLDVLVNNAGVVTNEKLGLIGMDNLRSMFEVNVFGMIDLTQMVATRLMLKQKSGSIVNIASIVGVEGSAGQTGYSASKGAVIAATKSMAKEWATQNIRVNAVAPGMIETERIKATIKNIYKGNIPEIGMKRLGTPQEIADACLYFSSDKSSYTTGQVLVVGGATVL